MTDSCITNTKTTTRSYIDLEIQINDVLSMARIAHHYAHDVVCENNEESLELCLFSATHVLDLAEKLAETFYGGSESEQAERAAAWRASYEAEVAERAVRDVVTA